MAIADETDAGRRPGSLARREGPDVPVTQGNRPEIAALHRNVPSDSPDHQRKRYCMQLLREWLPGSSRYPHGVGLAGVGVCERFACLWYDIRYRRLEVRDVDDERK